MCDVDSRWYSKNICKNRKIYVNYVKCLYKTQTMLKSKIIVCLKDYWMWNIIKM